MFHHTKVYHSLEEYLNSGYGLTDRGRRWAIRRWKLHIEKHGNVPFIQKCPICSGAELKNDIRTGRYRPKRLTKSERDYNRGTDQEAA